MPNVPFRSQILPSGVEAFDQPNLFHPAPALELFLAVDRFEHVIERFVVYETMAAVLLAKTMYKAILIFTNPPFQVVGHSNVEHS